MAFHNFLQGVDGSENVRPVANDRCRAVGLIGYGDELGKAVLRTNVVRCKMLPTACSANAQPLPLATGSSGPEERASARISTSSGRGRRLGSAPSVKNSSNR